jgi:hypothetical protein
MAECSKCGNSIADDQTVCASCGQPVAAEAMAPTATEAAQAAAAPTPPYAPQGTAAPLGGWSAQAPKKSKKGLWIALAALVVAIAVAAALVFGVFKDQIFGGASTPDKAVQKLISAVENKDADAFLDLVDPGTLSMLKALGMSSDDIKASLAEDVFTYDSIKFSGVKTETEMNGDNAATVTFTGGTVTTVQNGEETTEDLVGSEDWSSLQLAKIDGKWYMSADMF